ncbi:MAG: SAM-dependent methyltransferase [Candidatus Nanopelagicales bacterium]
MAEPIPQRTRYWGATSRLASYARRLGDYARGLDFESVVTAADSGLDEATASRSSPSGDAFLSHAVAALRIHPADRILDIGCGKGSAIRRLLREPFARVDGIELSEALAVIASRNFSRLREPRVRIHCVDAVAFEGYADYNAFYMYNPFPDGVLRQVLSAMRVADRRTETLLVYDNPVGHASVVAAGFATWRDFPDRWGNAIRAYSTLADGRVQPAASASTPASSRSTSSELE